MGDYKIVTFLFLFVCFGFVFVFVFFLANAKLSLLLQCKQGQMRAGYGALNLYKT